MATNRSRSVIMPGKRVKSPQIFSASHAAATQDAWREQIKRIESAERSAEAESSAIRVR